jgi:ACS family hexuronate transporter-like MFS transporter
MNTAWKTFLSVSIGVHPWFNLALSSEIQRLSPHVTVKNLRWWIAGLLALATALNYLDRQSFPVVVGEVKKEIPLTDAQYAHLTSLFLLAYAVMYAGGGRIMDWLGTRIGYAIMIVWWSAANFMLGTVNSFLGLGIFRFLLGIGEGGGFPGSGKAVAEWFPAKERSLAFGIFNAGSSLGAVIAPPLMAAIVAAFGWRWVFFITGSVGFVWAAVWLKLYRPPATNPYITTEERDYIAGAMDTPAAPAEKIPWLRLFTYRQVWALMAAKFLTDSVWYFLIFWIPKYLGEVRNLNIAQIGYLAWIPFAASGVGSLAGGWLSSFLIRRGVSLDLARKIALGVSACLMPVSLLTTDAPLSLTMVFLSTAMFGHQFWSSNVQTLPADLFPSRVVGSVEGLLGCAGAFGGMLFAQLVGKMVASDGYGVPFVMASVFHPIGFILILTIVRRIQRVTI